MVKLLVLIVWLMAIIHYFALKLIQMTKYTPYIVFAVALVALIAAQFSHTVPHVWVGFIALFSWFAFFLYMKRKEQNDRRSNSSS